MRFSVRHLMGIVAIVAVLTPFPLETVLNIAFAVLLWVPIAGIPVAIGCSSRLALASLAILAVYVIGLYIWLLPPAYRLRPVYWYMRAFDWLLLGLTSANLAGPFYVACRVRLGRFPLAGEILWAWQGVVWSVLMAGSHRFSGFHLLDAPIECTLLTLVLAILLAFYGSRPAQSDPSSWGHYFGWALVECDMIVWGWFASLILGGKWGWFQSLILRWDWGL